MTTLKKIDVSESCNRYQTYLDTEHFINEHLYVEYLSYFPNPLPENSLQATHPELAEEWDFAKRPINTLQFHQRANSRSLLAMSKGHLLCLRKQSSWRREWVTFVLGNCYAR